MERRTMETYLDEIANKLRGELIAPAKYEINGSVVSFAGINEGFVVIKEIVVRDPNMGSHDNADTEKTRTVLYIPYFLEQSAPPQTLVVYLNLSDQSGQIKSRMHARQIIIEGLEKMKKRYGIKEVVIIDPSYK